MVSASGADPAAWLEQLAGPAMADLRAIAPRKL
jgi:hypothetical protein